MPIRDPTRAGGDVFHSTDSMFWYQRGAFSGSAAYRETSSTARLTGPNSRSNSAGDGEVALRSRGIIPGPATKHIESWIGRNPASVATIALGTQCGADRRGEHDAHPYHAFRDPVFGRSWPRARLFRPADSAFNADLVVNRRRHEYRIVWVATDDGIGLAIRQPHTRRRLRDEPGAVLRHVRGQRPTANERTLPAFGQRPNGIRSWPAGVSGRTVVGRHEWKRYSGPRRSLLPVSTPAAGTADTLNGALGAGATVRVSR